LNSFQTRPQKIQTHKSHRFKIIDTTPLKEFILFDPLFVNKHFFFRVHRFLKNREEKNEKKVVNAIKESAENTRYVDT
jgi:hypothetical protein